MTPAPTPVPLPPMPPPNGRIHGPQDPKLLELAARLVVIQTAAKTWRREHGKRERRA